VNGFGGAAGNRREASAGPDRSSGPVLPDPNAVTSSATEDEAADEALEAAGRMHAFSPNRADGPPMPGRRGHPEHRNEAPAGFQHGLSGSTS
jgi:hypothetical protein